MRRVNEGLVRLRRGRDLERSLTLLRVFLLTSALICTGAGVALGSILARSLNSEALTAEKTALARYVGGVVQPALVRGNRIDIPWRQDAQLAEGVLRQPDIVSVKVWKANGVLAWTNTLSRSSRGRLVPNRNRREIDKNLGLDDELDEAIDENQPVAALVGTGGRGEDAFERNDLGYRNLFEVYAPIENANNTRVIGAYEIYADPRALDRLIGSRRTTLWLLVGGVFLALWAALVLLVRGASRTLRRQNATLIESNRLLEESALEAVESLNATVDAKDPYTAGHSQRVRRIAVAIGEELGLDAESLDVLRFAGLPRSRLAIEGRDECNPMARAIAGADIVSTVSERYAEEILTPEFGEGLEGLLQQRRADLWGITNGIDTAFFDPAHDPQIAERYGADDQAGKATDKAALQRETGLAVDPARATSATSSEGSFTDWS